MALEGEVTPWEVTPREMSLLEVTPLWEVSPQEMSLLEMSPWEVSPS